MNGYKVKPMSKTKKYLVLDCETATISEVLDRDYTPEQKQRVGISLPLIYDLAWIIVDRKGKIYSKHSIIIKEIFFNEKLFNTAYYKEKRPLYIEAIIKGEFEIMEFQTAIELLQKDCNNADIVTAQNCLFDFKKAIPFTKRFLNQEYTKQDLLSIMDNIANKVKSKKKNSDYLLPLAEIGDNLYPLMDIWEIAIDRLCGKKYKDYCEKYGFITDSGKYYKSSAETLYSYITKNPNYVEQHTALQDCIIEMQILLKAIKKKAVKYDMNKNINSFPFMKLKRE